MPNMNQQDFWRGLIARDASVGRYSGPEQHDLRSVDPTNPVTVSLLPFSLRRPIESIVVVFKGRITVTVGAYAQVGCEAPQNLIQRFILRGNHSKFGSQVPWDISGAAAFIYPMHFQREGGQVYLSKAGGNLTLQNNPSVPYTNTFDGTVATHDFLMIYHLQMPPHLGGQSGKRQEANYLFYARDWNDSLQLDIQIGDKSALGDSTGATVAFTAFQSATGNPSLQTLVNYGGLGGFEGAAVPGVTIRNEQLLTNVTAAGLQLRLMQLQKQITNSIIVKSGTIETTLMTAGVQTFETYSDLLLDRTQVLVDQKQIRRVDSNFAERGYVNRKLNNRPIQGHWPIMFIESQQALNAYRGDDPDIQSADFALFSDAIGVGANTRVSVIQERVIGGLYADLK